MKKIIGILLLYGILSSCSTIKEVPINNIDRIEYRDSVVYVHDTVSVPVPYEVVREVIPDVDTSYLETSVAKSIAYLDKDKKQLSHTLEQKGTVKTKIDTFIVVEYVDKYIEREVPIVTEVVKKVTPQWCWWLLVANALLIGVFIMKIYMKIKSGRLT